MKIIKSNHRRKFFMSLSGFFDAVFAGLPMDRKINGAKKQKLDFQKIFNSQKSFDSQ